MFNDVINPKEVTSNKYFPKVVMIIVVQPEKEINCIDSKSLD